jgi:CHAT domain-containing protein
LWLAERATEPNVRAADLSQTRILLFSTHGLTAAESNRVGLGEAGLVLTPPAVARDGDDGFLAASEVTSLRLNADWVILSACNTATGDGTSAAGLGSLARAFFYAGARNLLASHWPVSDEVAPILITRTLALERAGTPRAEAFRRAMREIRMDASRDSADDSWAHPFYWAPFVLIGDGGR